MGLGLFIGSFLLKMFTDKSLPRGIRNNNPGNIRRTNDQWQGMRAIQTDDEFVQFNDAIYGFRAMARILQNYQRRGLVTIRDIISTYAPKNENNTDVYINFVAQNVGILPDAIHDNGQQLFLIIKYMTRFENGPLAENFFSDDLIKEGISLA